MKISGIHIIIFILFIFTGCTNGSDKEDCNKSGGIWYESYCITESTPEKKLRELDLVEKKETDKYVIDIKYPYEVLKYPEIHSHLKDIVSAIKSESEVQNAPGKEISMSHPWTLEIEMDKVAHAGDLASVLVYSMTYTGGAHPNHYYRSVNFNTETQKLITLDELFADAQYIHDIAGFVTSELLEKKSEKTGMKVDSDEWIERGTLPLPGNFEIFVFVEADRGKSFSGMKFIFPPYTVGPYSDGRYEVKVPAEIFHEYLRNEYKEYFK